MCQLWSILEGNSHKKTVVIANHKFQKGSGLQPRVKPATAAAEPQFQLSNFREEKLSIFGILL